MPKRGADFLALSRVPFPTSVIAIPGDHVMPKKTKKKPAKKVAKKAPRAPKKKASAKASPRKPSALPASQGAVVTGTDPCACGHSPEEHGHDPKYPGSTACTALGCECIAYEADPQETTFEDDHPVDANAEEDA